MLKVEIELNPSDGGVGAYCNGVGEALNYDKATAAVKRQRRRQAGCIATGGNRCSTKQNHGPGFQCDEYPYASTDSPKTRGNRCVPSGQNSKQGGYINGFYKSQCKSAACSFKIGFDGITGIDVCNKAATGWSCSKYADGQANGPARLNSDSSADVAADGTDVIPAGDEEYQKRHATAHRYLTNTGREVTIPAGAVIGSTIVTMEPRNATLWEEQAYDMGLVSRDGLEGEQDEDEDYGMDAMIDNLEARQEMIVQEIV
ncbi:hypothetical protein G7Y89_g4616 [Cudoniella acicularis]|uniref:Deoxyribonuclease NucA/NucB domain-containing protein n=1 Tax=Cudoniella acicularis TaxID=354080 RepID=A0A8H4RPX1_9HELO|nr:hypothetical protein G7Y89_g4616 [Cudoniella acicularis]